jgi:hypothetical protein
MAKVVAGITMSVDGYITGPNDGPGQGLGEGGERLHYWVFGGPWGYEEEPRGEPTGADKEFFDQAVAGSKVVPVMGGADGIRQALRAGGYVEEVSISIAPVVLGAGKRLFEGFDETVSLEHFRLLQSSFATHITYRVVR